MIKTYRFRRLFAPAAGFRKAVLITVSGLLIFLIGSALSFRAIIRPVLEALQRAVINVLSFMVPEESADLAAHLLGGAFLVLGATLTFIGLRAAIRHLWATINPQSKGGMADIYWRRQQLAQGPRIVALGGGTGLSTLLRGLKQHSSNITAVVTVTDEGGSSGRLTREKGIIPPGDIRNCLVALADAEKAMIDLFQYRFKNDSGSLSGHSVGNLLITAFADMERGDFEQAVERASDVLAIRGHVVPSTLQHVRLRAVLDNGSEVCGEMNIVQAGRPIRQIYLDPADVQAHKSAIEAIKQADLICIGPGSVYTSVIPNLLVPEIAETIKNSPAMKVYICNVMTQPGESDSFSACEHVVSIQTNVKTRVFDYVLVNTGVPSPTAIEKYRESGQYFVDPDTDRIKAMGFRPIPGDFMSESDFVRHDPNRVATKLMALLEGK